MHRKSSVLTFLTIITVLTLGVMSYAQSSSQPLPPPERPNLSHVGNGYGDSLHDSAKPLAVGWNYYHIGNCTMYTNGGYDILIAYMTNGTYFYTYDSQFQNVMSPSCQSGNWIAIYVTDVYGDWNQVWTYTYK